MPLKPQRFDYGLCHRLPTFPTLGTVSIRMTTHTPSIAVLLYERRGTVERIAALRAEEVSRVPLSTAGDDNLALDWGFAGLATWAEEFVEVEVAVEAEGSVAVSGLLLERFLGTHVFGNCKGRAGMA